LHHILFAAGRNLYDGSLTFACRSDRYGSRRSAGPGTRGPGVTGDSEEQVDD